MGRSKSYVEKYLRIYRLSPEQRAESLENTEIDSFRSLWAHFFPSNSKGKKEPSAEELERQEQDADQIQDVEFSADPDFAEQVSQYLRDVIEHQRERDPGAAMQLITKLQAQLAEEYRKTATLLVDDEKNQSQGEYRNH